MADFALLLKHQDGPDRRYRVKSGGVQIGRHSENDIVLTEQLVSRRHARVWTEGEVLRVLDLDSSNGVEVNGARVKEAVLHEGDSLLIGGNLFIVARSGEGALGRTVIGPEDADGIHAAMLADTQGARLPVLYRAAQLMGTVFDVDALLGEVLDLLFEALPVRRGYVITVEAAGSEPLIRASRSVEEEDGGTPLSHTMIEHVIQRGEAILTVNAQDDSRFDHSESIAGFGIHSAMCAPLPGRKQVVGAVYVDTGSESTPFPRGDLELLTTIGRIAGVAVENAQLYRENVQRERLAAIGEATAGLGHCVKNILTGIRGGAELVNRAIEREDLAVVRKGWGILSLSFERIDLLVQNLLTYSRPKVQDRASTDVNGLVREVLGVVSSRAERHGTALVFEPSGDIRCPADGRELYRALLNLVTNAVEACERHGDRVSVYTRADARQCVICVEDDGPGIGAESMARLGQAFASTKGSSGTGLGLACTVKIVSEHGGRLDAESREGDGAAFTLYLPMGAEPVDGPANGGDVPRRTLTPQSDSDGGA